MLICAAIVIAIVLFFSFYKPSAKNYDSFAQCITSKGMAMYGAYWCPHCLDQKNMFGTSVEYINYTECSLPDNAGETAECKAAGIQSYPTWQMPDGRKVPGELSLQEISTISGCTLPA